MFSTVVKLIAAHQNVGVKKSVDNAFQNVTVNLLDRIDNNFVDKKDLIVNGRNSQFVIYISNHNIFKNRLKLVVITTKFYHFYIYAIFNLLILQTTPAIQFPRLTLPQMTLVKVQNFILIWIHCLY